MGIYIIALYLGALAAPLIGAYLAAAWDYRAVFVRSPSSLDTASR